MVDTINNLERVVISSCKVISSCAVNPSNDGKYTPFIKVKQKKSNCGKKNGMYWFMNLNYEML